MTSYSQHKVLAYSAKCTGNNAGSVVDREPFLHLVALIVHSNDVCTTYGNEQRMLFD